MKIIHTADWHLGQSFFNYDRLQEHRAFLDWLLIQLAEKQIDVLLISGDVFDSGNPSTASQRLLYSFLNQAQTTCPSLQIILTAGNHDSPQRLETVQPLLDENRVKIIGHVQRNSDGKIDYSSLFVPVKSENQVQAYIFAVPFLRLGDYPTDKGQTYSQGVAEFYQNGYQFFQEHFPPSLPLIALGHLYAQHAELSDEDKNERLIMGGTESVGLEAFNKGFDYVALGHIHKAQKIGGNNHIRYSGSPLPMSFSELNYKHQVLMIQTEKWTIEPLYVPRLIPLLRIPDKHQTLDVALEELRSLEELTVENTLLPYLQVNVLLKGPEPRMKVQVEEALQNKAVRLVRIDAKYEKVESGEKQKDILQQKKLQELNPTEIFERVLIDKVKIEEDHANYLEMFKEIYQLVEENKANQS